jgi:AraC-like DNA-binding protein
MIEVTCGAEHERCALEMVSGAYRLVFTREGAAAVREVVAPGGTTTADPLQVLLLEPGAHYVANHVAARPHRCTVFAVSKELARAISAKSEGHLGPGDYRRLGCLLDSRLLMAFRVTRRKLLRAGAEEDPAFGEEEAALSLWAEVLDTRAAALVRDPESAGVMWTSRRRQKLVESIKGILATDPGEAHSLELLAARFSVSSSQLAHVFPAVSGLPLHRYLLRLRTALALNALEAGTADLSRLALDLGFSTHSHFSAAFRRCLGMSPGDARRLLACAERGALGADRTIQR